MTINVTPLPFHGDLIDYLNLNGRTLEWLWRDHEAYIPVRPICEALDLAYQPQHRKLSAPESEAVVTKRVTTGADGKRYEMFCVAYPDFLIWLATITPSRVKEEARDALMQTRREIKQVLSAYYRERLFGERVMRDQSHQAFEVDWLMARAWRPAVLRGCRNGWSFAQIRAAAKPSHAVWRIADDCRTGLKLGFYDALPADLPAPRVTLEPAPATDPRQSDMFAEG